MAESTAKATVSGKAMHTAAIPAKKLRKSQELPNVWLCFKEVYVSPVPTSNSLVVAVLTTPALAGGYNAELAVRNTVEEFEHAGKKGTCRQWLS
jgi:hypothetical protein